MADFYTVDRIGSLTTGATLEWRTFTDVQPDELQTHVNRLYPNEVLRHGDGYFVTQPKQPNAVNEIIEILTEYVRRCALSGTTIPFSVLVRDGVDRGRSGVSGRVLRWQWFDLACAS